MAVSKRTRFEVLRRDNHQCRYCGASAPNVPLVVDHVVPVALGGSDDPSNLVAACRDCNAGKSSVVPDHDVVADVRADAARWATAMEKVAEDRAAEREDWLELNSWFNMIWCEWSDPRTGEPYHVSPDWTDSVARFLRAGLQRVEIVELLRIAMQSNARDKWRYFCGCCNNRIRQNVEMAARIVATQQEVSNGA